MFRRPTEDGHRGKRCAAEQIASLSQSQVTVGELVFGAEKSQSRDKNRRRIQLLTAGIPALPVDETAWRHFGALEAGLQKIGRPVADLDTLIAATAQRSSLARSTFDDGLHNLSKLDPQPITVERW